MLLRSLYEKKMSAHMTPFQETARRNGNLHRHLKILFIRRKLFRVPTATARADALEQKNRIIAVH